MTTDQYLEKMREILHYYQHPLDSAFKIDFTKDLVWHPIIKQEIRDKGISHLNWGLSNRELALDLIYERLEKIEPFFSTASDVFKKNLKDVIDLKFLLLSPKTKDVPPSFAEVYHKFNIGYVQYNSNVLSPEDFKILAKISLEKEIKELFSRHLGANYETELFDQFLEESPSLVKQIMDKKLAS